MSNCKLKSNGSYNYVRFILYWFKDLSSRCFSGWERLNSPNLLWRFFFLLLLWDAGMWDVAAVAQANLQICSICFLSRVSLAVSVSFLLLPSPLQHHPFMSLCTYRPGQIVMKRRKLMYWKHFFSKCTHSMVVE